MLVHLAPPRDIHGKAELEHQQCVGGRLHPRRSRTWGIRVPSALSSALRTARSCAARCGAPPLALTTTVTQGRSPPLQVKPAATVRSPVGSTAPHRGTAGATEPRPARYHVCGHGHPRIGFQMSRCLMLALHACRWLTWCCMGRRRTLHYGLTWHRSATPAAVVDFLRRSMLLNGDLLQTCGDVRRNISWECHSGSHGAPMNRGRFSKPCLR